MATSFTQDEYLVLQHLLSGKGTEEIATILELPLHVVRTCIHMLVTWVLDELEPSQNGPVPSTVGMSDRDSADTENSMASRPFARTRSVRAHTRGVRPHRELCERSPLQIGAARRRLSRTLGTGVLPMTVQVVAIDDGVLVDGELDMDAADDFLRLAEASVDGTHEVVLDIADLGFIDSAGVGAILRLASTSCPNGIVLRRPREGVQRVLDIGKIEEIPGIRVERRDA